MDVLYIPQLDEVNLDDSGVASSRYRLLRRVPENTKVLLTDRAVTRIEIAETSPVKVILPPAVKGQVRDFFVRIVITADEVPEITFAAPDGEIVSFEDMDEDVFKCEVGVNVFAFTETDNGIFIVNRKQVDIDVSIEFDPCGGILDETVYEFKLGAQYATLPKPTMPGYVFQGWFTEAEGGIFVSSTDRVKTGVSKLYAQWAEYVDPFVDYICEEKNLTFHSDDDIPWKIDESTAATDGSPGSARSGAIGDNGSTTLSTTVVGRGTLSFKWKVSSEGSYDEAHFIVDGNTRDTISGFYDWCDMTVSIDSEGSHEIMWRYTKDSSVSEGSDCVWVDDVVWAPEGGE